MNNVPKVQEALTHLLSLVGEEHPSYRHLTTLIKQAERPTPVVVRNVMAKNDRLMMIRGVSGLHGTIFYLARSMTPEAQDGDLDRGLENTRILSLQCGKPFAG